MAVIELAGLRKEYRRFRRPPVGSFLEGLRRWLILGNAIVLVSGENSGGDVTGRSVVATALYLTAVGIGLLALATVVFRRRDVA